MLPKGKAAVYFEKYINTQIHRLQKAEILAVKLIGFQGLDKDCYAAVASVWILCTKCIT
jgi:hypothetical protein